MKQIFNETTDNYYLTSLLIVVALLFSHLSASAGAEVDSTIVPKTIKIGCLYPLIGSGSLYGKDSVAAIKIAEEDIKQYWPNSEFDFEVLIGDTRSKTLRAVQVARNFINNDNVDFLCGVISSRIALAVSDVAKNNQIFFIGTDHASPRLVSEAKHANYFRMSNDSRQSMYAGAKYLAKYYNREKPLRIVFVGPDYDYGYQSWSDLQIFLRKENVNYDVVGEFYPKLFEKNYNIYHCCPVNFHNNTI
jgi:branched-chain amino acid transport system substrate-binding protein